MDGKYDKFLDRWREDDATDPALLDLFLKIDQTVSQYVINGSPQFDEGIVIKANKKVYLDGL